MQQKNHWLHYRNNRYKNAGFQPGENSGNPDLMQIELAEQE
jgi:hypothetical protein